MSSRAMALVFSFPLVLGGCMISTLGSSDALRDRAAFDFSCPKDQLVITDLGLNVRGVEGCGKKATYVRAGNGAWVLNSESTSQPSK